MGEKFDIKTVLQTVQTYRQAQSQLEFLAQKLGVDVEAVPQLAELLAEAHQQGREEQEVEPPKRYSPPTPQAEEPEPVASPPQDLTSGLCEVFARIPEFKRTGFWSGRPTALFETVSQLANGASKTCPNWPKSVLALSSHLLHNVDGLKKRGISFTHKSAAGGRLITLTRLGRAVEAPEPDEEPVEEEEEQTPRDIFVSYLRDHPGMTTKDLKENVGLPQRLIVELIRALRDERVIQKRSGRWILRGTTSPDRKIRGQCILEEVHHVLRENFNGAVFTSNEVASLIGRTAYDIAFAMRKLRDAEVIEVAGRGPGGTLQGRKTQVAAEPEHVSSDFVERVHHTARSLPQPFTAAQVTEAMGVSAGVAHQVLNALLMLKAQGLARRPKGRPCDGGSWYLPELQ